MRYEIIHRTRYDYSQDVSVSHHVARLTPRATARQIVVAHQLEIDPPPAARSEHPDYYGNISTFFSTHAAHRTLQVTARSEVEVRPGLSPLGTASPPWETVRHLCRTGSNQIPPDVQEFRFPSAFVPRLAALAEYATASFTPDRPLLEALLDLTRRIHDDFKFDPKATTISTPMLQILRNRCGVCQDFAHLQIGCLRALDLPARYVSGYIETLPPPGQPKLTGADASHAWIQAFAPPTGWIDIDPTNNLLPTSQHLTLAWGRDFGDVSPIRGVIVGGGKHTLSVAVDVAPRPCHDTILSSSNAASSEHS